MGTERERMRDAVSAETAVVVTKAELAAAFKAYAKASADADAYAAAAVERKLQIELLKKALAEISMGRK